MTESELKWRLRRSTLELDILLQYFFNTHYSELSIEERNTFIEWVKLEDEDWKALLTKDHPLINKIRHCQVEKGKL